MSINARIRKRKSNIGYSRNFSVIENFRRKDETGKPTHRVILYLGTLRQDEYYNKLKCFSFLQKAEGAVNLLVLQNKITVLDAKKVKDKFRKELQPVSPTPVHARARSPIAITDEKRKEILAKRLNF